MEYKNIATIIFPQLLAPLFLSSILRHILDHVIHVLGMLKVLEGM
jgi:hypothetical protein